MIRLLHPRGFIDGYFLTALNSLQGALGRTASRSYKAAPRQLLQVNAASPTDSDHPAGSPMNGDGAGDELAKSLNGATADVCV